MGKIYHGRYGDVSTDFNNEEELGDLIATLMIKDDPDGNCDGYEIMAKIIWERIEDLLLQNEAVK